MQSCDWNLEMFLGMQVWALDTDVSPTWHEYDILISEEITGKKQQKCVTAQNHEAEPAGFDTGPREPWQVPATRSVSDALFRALSNTPLLASMTVSPNFLTCLN